METIAAVTPKKSKRRWSFRFRLRTLLIVVALVAIECAAATWVIRDRQRLIRERDELRARVQPLWNMERQSRGGNDTGIAAKYDNKVPAPPISHSAHGDGDPFFDDQP